VGGQQTGSNLSNVTQSDGGMLFVNNHGSLVYWQKSHLASQFTSPVWTIGPGDTPYYREIQWISDPQRVFNNISIQPFSPDGASLPLVVPSNAAAVNASQKQYGPQPKQPPGYLQSTTEMQNFADWIFANFGSARIRAENVRIDAAPAPGLWPMVLGLGVGDVVTAQMWAIGNTGITNTMRTTRFRRKIIFNEDEESTEASLQLWLDPEPGSYWT
jgi:hypothetical protein